MSWDFLWVFIFYFFLGLTLVWLVTTEIHFFALKSKKKKVLDRGVCVVISFSLDIRIHLSVQYLDASAGVTQEEGHT